MELQEAFVQLKDNKELARKFTEDPQGTLKELGVEDTQDLVIRKIPGGNAPFENFASAVDAASTEEKFGDTICVSVGFGVCASVG